MNKYCITILYMFYLNKDNKCCQRTFHQNQHKTFVSLLLVIKLYTFRTLLSIFPHTGKRCKDTYNFFL